MQTGTHRAAAALTALVLLAGCKDEAKAPAAASGGQRVREAAEQNIRAGTAAPAQTRFRGVQIYAQAMPQRTAICGQVAPFGDDAKIFVPFVSIVTTADAAESAAPQYKFEQFIGSTPSEASRVYLALVNYCFDKGGPAAGAIRSVMPMAPVPDTIVDPSPKAAPAPPPVAAASPAAVAGQTPAVGSVTMRQNGNLHSDPHGPTVKVVPQGTVMRVFSQATGGWYQVGDTAPWGWVHDSMLDKR